MHPRRLPALPATPEALRVSVTSRRRKMRNLSPRSFSVRPLVAALLLGGAAFVISEIAAPADAHAVPRTATVMHGDAVGGFSHPGVSRRLIRPRSLRPRPQRRLRPRASR